MTKEERTEQARTLHRQGCNCCQAVVEAYADRLPLAPQDAHNLAAPFGRGLAGQGEVCGCVSGMAMVCGLVGHAADTRTLVDQFRASNGDIVCHRLLANGKKPCRELVAEAAAMLSDII